MYEIRKTDTFVEWFDNLKDRCARARIQMRIDLMQLGNFGDVSAKDIAQAKEMARQLED